jgi:hypothetical protein
MLSRNANTSAGGSGGPRQYGTGRGTGQQDGLKTKRAGNQHQMVGSMGQFDVWGLEGGV